MHRFGISILVVTAVGLAFASAPTMARHRDQAGASQTPAAGETKVTVSETGFEPAKVNVVAGKPVRLVFTRTAERTCATEVVLKDQNIKRELPLNKPVTVEFTPTKKGELTFTCGQNMFRGTIVVG
jgi:plastocyanin domain-containing protein